MFPPTIANRQAGFGAMGSGKAACRGGHLAVHLLVIEPFQNAPKCTILKAKVPK